MMYITFYMVQYAKVLFILKIAFDLNVGEVF